ncbi:hypothetical protein [Rhizobium sp.]|jgi:hypothetical protein|uniref:hypothetical protein n=1 Tax=Rhizobium sp. TaxID=391 RepID=UPI002AA87A5E
MSLRARTERRRQFTERDIRSLCPSSVFKKATKASTRMEYRAGETVKTTVGANTTLDKIGEGHGQLFSAFACKIKHDKNNHILIDNTANRAKVRA